jgi:cysteine desulfurase
MKRLYLDHNATSPLLAAVRETMQKVLRDDLGNPGSVHTEGQDARAKMEAARNTILGALSGESGSLTFTSGATESNNLVLRSYAKRGPIVLSRLDHPSVVATGDELVERGWEIRWVPNDEQGRILEDALEEMLDGASLFSIAWANNELGNMRPVHRLAKLCAKTETVFHVDAAQTFCRFDLGDISDIDAITLSAHKAGGPPGIGGLYLKRKVGVEPLTTGGHQERGRRPGTENLLGVLGWQALVESFEPEQWNRLEPLRDRLEAFLVEEFDAIVNAGADERMPHTTNLSFPGLESEALVMALDLEGLAISAGSACTAGSIDISPVLQSLGVGDERARSAIRLSLGPEWNEEMLEDAIERFRRVLLRMRQT